VAASAGVSTTAPFAREPLPAPAAPWPPPAEAPRESVVAPSKTVDPPPTPQAPRVHRSAPRPERPAEDLDTPTPGARGILGAAVAGAIAGYALAFVVDWPMDVWTGIGATAGLVGGWGWRRWTSARS
jgi:hypothetical protein